MVKATLVVLTNPVAGREDDCNDWYTNRHLGDMLEITGIVSAKRLKKTEDQVRGRC